MTSQTVRHSGRQLAAVEIGDKLVAAVAMKSGAAVSADVEPDPGSPTGLAAWRQCLGCSAPLVITKAGKLIGNDLGFERTRCGWLDERQIAATCTVYPGDRAQRRPTVV